MALVSKILGCLAVLCAAFLFAAALDIGHVGLNQLGMIALAPISFFVIFSIAHIFMSGGSGGGDEEFDEEEFMEAFKEFKSKIAGRMGDFQTTLDSMNGEDKDTLSEENKQLKEQLEAIHQAERDKVLTEAESLRSRNEELERQIKEWAIKTVDDTVKPEDAVEAA